MKIGDRVYAPSSKHYGTILRQKVQIGHVFDYGVLVDGDATDNLWGYDKHELLPVKVSVLEGEVTRCDVRGWLVGGEALRNYMLLKDLGTTIRITIEKVREAEPDAYHRR